jgi:hypothetical protein
VKTLKIRSLPRSIILIFCLFFFACISVNATSKAKENTIELNKRFKQLETQLAEKTKKIEALQKNIKTLQSKIAQTNANSSLTRLEAKPIPVTQLLVNGKDFTNRTVENQILQVNQYKGTKWINQPPANIYISIGLASVIFDKGCSWVAEGNEISFSGYDYPNTEVTDISQLDYGKPVNISVAWNNSIYVVTDEKLTSQEIGSEIGLIKRQVSPKPAENGDIARNTSDGPAISGVKLYEIKGIDSKDAIALYFKDNAYNKCKYLGALNK